MLERLQKIFNEVVGRTDIVLTPKTSIDDSTGISSFMKIQLICAIEEEFGVEVPNKELRKLKTVKNVISFLEKAIE